MCSGGGVAFYGGLFQFGQASVVQRDRVFSTKHTEQAGAVLRVDDRQFVEVELGEPPERRVQIVLGRYGDELGGHDVAGQGELKSGKGTASQWWHRRRRHC